MQSAQHAMRPSLPKRFYKTVSVGGENGFHILLDGKPVKTPAKRRLALPRRELADIVAGEWDAQERDIDPARMPMTRLANLAIDRAEGSAGDMADEILRYAGSDLVLYRAGEPEGLVALQARHWDPVLRWAREALGANFMLAEGVNFVAQSEPALAAIKKEIERYPPPFALTALASITQLTGSALIALMLGRGKLTTVEAWNAAHVDEDWNAQTWGEDREAAAKRAQRLSEFEAAAKLLELSRAG
jgi:chaperone required for assembly of F1-ATPase